MEKKLVKKGKEFNIKPFKSPGLEYYRVLKMIKYYFADFTTQYDIFRQEVAYYEYSKGNDCLYRGYYCPSMVLDIIVGGFKRGRISKVSPQNLDSYDSQTYRYGFNEKGQLIIAETLGQGSRKEILLHFEDLVMSLSCYIEEAKLCIDTYTECYYDDERIIQRIQKRGISLFGRRVGLCGCCYVFAGKRK